jgi:TRAP-type mannitol/chloroaromatic compound transport system permease small subunit
VLLSVLLSALTATLRYTLDWGSNAMIEGQWFMFGLIFLFYAPLTLQERGHVRVDILYNRLPPRGRVLVEILGGLLFLLPICLLIVIDAWGYFLIAFEQNESSVQSGRADLVADEAGHPDRLRAADPARGVRDRQGSRRPDRPPPVARTHDGRTLR